MTCGGGCKWIASSNEPWITVASGRTGTGNGAVAFSVAANTGPQRTGTIAMAGQPFTVTQASVPVASVSAASFRAGEVATESIVAAFGTGLATASRSATTSPLPTELAGTTVRIKDSLNTERSAPLFFVSPTQVNLQIPPGTASGAATITITSGDGAVSTGTAQIAAVAPGLFTAAISAVVASVMMKGSGGSFSISVM
ncbi:MAG: BACON domain-containing protein [Blastocatellia bacterium]